MVEMDMSRAESGDSLRTTVFGIPLMTNICRKGDSLFCSMEMPGKMHKDEEGRKDEVDARTWQGW
jgi:hypothetical protein